MAKKHTLPPLKTAQHLQAPVGELQPKSIGPQLIAARMACKLSLNDIANETRILLVHLEAFESDQPLPLAQAYVLGYLRRIADILSLDAELLILQYVKGITVEFTETADDESLCSTLGSALPEKNISDSANNDTLEQKDKTAKVLFPLKALTGFYAGSSWAKAGVNKVAPRGLWRTATAAVMPMLCLCFLAFAYHSIDDKFDTLQSPSRHIGANNPDQLGTLAHEALIGTGSIDTVDSIENISLNSARIASYTDESQQDAAPVVTTAVVNNSVQQQAVLPLVEQRFIANKSLVTLNNAEPTRLKASEQIRHPVPFAAPGAASMISMHNMQDRLVIDVYEDSWVDVRDSQGIRLYRDLARAGRRIDVSGELPFALHLGNAPGLALELNGEPVSITRYRSDNSARLTLASN